MNRFGEDFFDSVYDYALTQTSQWVFSARKRAGMSLKRLSEVTGISEDRLFDLEEHMHVITFNELAAIAEATNQIPSIELVREL